MTTIEHPAADVGRAQPKVDPLLAALPGRAVDDEPASRRPHPVAAIGVAAVVIVGGTWFAASLLSAPDDTPSGTVAALTNAQVAADRLDAEDVARLVVDPASTRLLVRTDEDSYYVARSLSGELCLARVPDGDLPTASCVPDRVGADTTLAEEGSGQVRLVADGGPVPSAGEGWRAAGPNVWVRD